MESFDHLHEKYTPMIHKIMNTLHIYQNKKEFYQSALIALWKAWQEFDDTKGSFTSYAYTTIKGTLMKELTAATKRKDTLVFPKEEYWTTLENEHLSLNVELNEKELLLMHCSQLTPNQTKWVIHTFLYDQTINEIAQKEGVSPSTVKKWRAGAKEKLKSG